jgi:putative N6-adenine-specific DNA methylase
VTSLECYAIVAPGLESLTATELVALGIPPGETGAGGVAFQATLGQLYLANLHLRTASRIIVRLASFRATAFYELEKRAKKVPWTAWVSPGAMVEFRVTSRKSKLYHGRAVAERLAVSLAAAVSGVVVQGSGERGAGEDEGSGEDHAYAPDSPVPIPQQFVVRLFRDLVTISIDSSGELLHRRGYRLATARAPLRETLAAAMLLASGWDGRAALTDPMCGSGTIPIEAALLARRIAPGLRRGFGFEHWPTFDSRSWAALRSEAEEKVLPHLSGPISGSDRDAGAVEAALANATRAGVVGDVSFRRAALSALAPSETEGWIVTNPPYGLRVGERVRLRDLYAQLGNVVRRCCPRWHVAMLSADAGLEQQTGLAFETKFQTKNGGIAVKLAYHSPSGAA